MSPVDLAFLGVIVFFIIVFAVVLGRVVAKEARENREAREAYDQRPSWTDLV